MQKCKYCGQDLSDDARVCLFCGQPVESEDEERRRRLMLRWHLGALLQGMKRPTRSFPFSLAHPITTAGQQLPVAIIVFLISVLVLLNIVLVGFLEPRNGSGSVQISVSPTLLNFGNVEIDSQAVLAVMVKTSNQSQLIWKIVSGNAQWLSIKLKTETKEPDNTREVIYDVTANTSKLQVGPYSETLSVSSDGGKDQRVDVKIAVTRGPQPAKLNVNPLVLDFGSQNKGNQKTLLLTASNSGGRDLSWTADKGKTPWLTLDTSGGKIASGGPPQVIKVIVDTAALTEGRYSGVINFTSNDGNATVDVRLNVVSTPIAEQGPMVSSISPTSGPATGGTTVTITGSRFTGATSVSFGSTAGTIVSVDSDSQITAISPAGNGNVDVTVTTPSGASNINGNDQFTYIPRPMVKGIGPKCELTAGGTTVVITGSGFTGATSVSFGSTAGTIASVDSDSQITAISPAGSGTVDVTVTTPGGTSATSPADQFTYPPPSVTSISPMKGPESGGTPVTITGSGFNCATGVSFGSTAATNFIINSDTQITAISPGLGICAAYCNTVDVTVMTPRGTSATSKADLFTYLPPPIVTGIRLRCGPTNGGITVTIFGYGFTGATGVSFGSTAAAKFTVDSDSQITAVSPAGSGTVHVTVTTPGGTSAPSKADLFTYPPPPSVTSINPTSGPASGSTPVTITGSGFTCATGVSFGSTAAMKFTVDSDTQITATSPAGSGIVDVTVTTPRGTSATSKADLFTYILGYKYQLDMGINGWWYYGHH
jgi:uncharacterized membrane protein